MKISYKILHYLKAVKEQMTTLKQEYKDGMQDFKKKNIKQQKEMKIELARSEKNGNERQNYYRNEIATKPTSQAE